MSDLAIFPSLASMRQCLATSLSMSLDVRIIERNRILFITSVIVVSAYFVVRYITSPWRSMPPGPRGLPLLGNALDLRSKQWLTFTEWGKTYGDIISIMAAGQPILVLNSQKAAADLLDRRAGIYSDRPLNIVASDILCGGLVVILIRYGDTWRRMRKAAHEGLNKGVVHKYHDIQTTEGLILTSGILSEPKYWDQHLRRAAASSIMSIIYDQPPIASEQDPSVVKINNFNANTNGMHADPNALVALSALGRILPVDVAYSLQVSEELDHIVKMRLELTAVPQFYRFAKWKREAEGWHNRDSVMFEGLFDDVHSRVAKGDERPSLAATLIKDASRHNLSVRENAWVAAAMYAAGAETTATALEWWMMAMVVYPETQKRAQDELDDVVGRSRMPTFADIEHLPYIRAMVKEVLRWRPVTPLSLPHRLMEDDWYKGYFIPKGTIVLGNVWQLNKDPEIYGADAAHFNPARHLDANGRLAPGPVECKEDSHFTYGFGRRICVGKHVANNSLFIDIAMILWAMNIERGVDEDGNLTPLDVDGCHEDGIVVRPLPFEVRTTIRFPEAQSILDEEREQRGH